MRSRQDALGAQFLDRTEIEVLEDGTRAASAERLCGMLRRIGTTCQAVRRATCRSRTRSFADNISHDIAPSRRRHVRAAIIGRWIPRCLGRLSFTAGLTDLANHIDSLAAPQCD